MCSTRFDPSRGWRSWLEGRCSHPISSCSSCCIHEYDGGVNQAEQCHWWAGSGSRPPRKHWRCCHQWSWKLIWFSRIWLIHDFSLLLNKELFQLKILIFSSRYPDIPKHFNAWRILLDAFSVNALLPCCPRIFGAAGVREMHTLAATCTHLHIFAHKLHTI